MDTPKLRIMMLEHSDKKPDLVVKKDWAKIEVVVHGKVADLLRTQDGCWEIKEVFYTAMAFEESGADC